jgi:mono/diheme cytochrome c family protein
MRGQVEQVHRDARDLTTGPETQTEVVAATEALDRVSASLGFLQTARSTEELSAGLSRAALACGACHRALEVDAPLDRPEWTHQSAWDWAIFGAVWGQLDSPPDGASAVEQTLKAAYVNPSMEAPDTGKAKAPGAVQRLGALLGACWGCHPTDSR